MRGCPSKVKGALRFLRKLPSATLDRGTEVILTPKEVTHARENPCTALFVLSGITVERTEDGMVAATGGKHRCFDPWRLDDGTLTPLGFRYQVPASRAEDAELRFRA